MLRVRRPIPVSVGLQMANDSTETSEGGRREEDHEGDGENKERDALHPVAT